jgi:hypothetical protein
MGRCVVILALERQELVNSLHGRGIPAGQTQCGTPGQHLNPILDSALLCRHAIRTRNVSGMNEAGQPEVTFGELNRYFSHVAPNLGGAGAVGGVPLELDSAAIGERLEDMARRVLVHSHRHLAADLNPSESGVDRRPSRSLSGWLTGNQSQ